MIRQEQDAIVQKLKEHFSRYKYCGNAAKALNHSLTCACGVDNSGYLENYWMFVVQSMQRNQLSRAAKLGTTRFKWGEIIYFYFSLHALLQEDY